MQAQTPAFTPESYDALVLAVAAMVLFCIAWGLDHLLTWCADVRLSVRTTSLGGRLSQTRVGSALVITKIIFFLHLLNIATFSFLKSGYAALASWIPHLLPEKANTLIMLLSYYITFSVIKITWRDLRIHLQGFVRKSR